MVLSEARDALARVFDSRFVAMCVVRLLRLSVVEAW